MSDPPALAGERFEIVRDSTFVRFVADQAIISDMGRDLEVAFLQFGPVLTASIDYDDREEIEARSTVTEVARMRISFPAMLKMVMSFIEGGLEDGKIKPDAVLRSVTDWASAAKRKKEAEDGGPVG